MSYTDTMTNTEIRKALSYLIYKRMMRINTLEDDKTKTELKNALDERSTT